MSSGLWVKDVVHSCRAQQVKNLFTVIVHNNFFASRVRLAC